MNVGETIPPFQGQLQSGGAIGREDLLGKGPVVLFFYPKDGSPGCTAQACAFRDQYEVFQEAGAEVYGISTDSAQRHQGFRAQHRLPFPLISDPKGEISKAFGVKKTLGLLPGRVTYVLDAEGVVQHRFSSQLQPTRHVQEALEVVQRLVRS